MEPLQQNGSVQNHEQRAFSLFAQGRFADAVAEFEAVARLAPDTASAHSNLAAALGQAGQLAASVASFERALALDPGLTLVHLNLATLLTRLGQPLEAVARLRDAQRRFPADPNVHLSAGQLYYTQGLREEALTAFARVLELDPEHARARWLRTVATLPQAYGPGEDPAVFRLEFEAELRSMARWLGAHPSARAAEAVAERHPFYLAFMEESNTALLSDYGDLCARVITQGKSATPESPVAVGATRPAPMGPGNAGPVRVAVVSGYLYDQSVWTALLRGWFGRLSRDRVELHLFHTGHTRDAQTEIARSHAATFTMGLGTLDAWVEAIGRIAPDVILYPEIGMDSTAGRLAALRLAPTQVVSWGHPETSGYPTLDYYLSAAAFEPSGAQANYREKLVTLPGIGCYYDDLVPEFEGTDWAALGVDPYLPRLLCAGTPYKYMPQHDALLVEIAQRAPDAQLLFFVDRAPLLSESIERRLAIAFDRAGLDARRNVRFLPYQSRPAFFGMLRDCDAMLDTVGFSGFNTAMQAIECDLPIVAWEGKFMRGRLASGTLRTMGMDELVATTPEQYVDLAVRLCRDGTYRLKTAARIGERKGVLFRDLASVRALEDFLVRVARER